MTTETTIRPRSVFADVGYHTERGAGNTAELFNQLSMLENQIITRAWPGEIYGHLDLCWRTVCNWGASVEDGTELTGIGIDGEADYPFTSLDGLNRPKMANAITQIRIIQMTISAPQKFPDYPEFRREMVSNIAGGWFSCLHTLIDEHLCRRDTHYWNNYPPLAPIPAPHPGTEGQTPFYVVDIATK